ncbi:MAG: hypothetical protein M3O25_08055, partial [Actinomycetota bacterium]|nr:hypothetical protein [Actinomycetota bacterium]
MWRSASSFPPATDPRSWRLPAGEDRECSDRARALGHPPRFDDAAIVIHHQRLTSGSFARQQLGYGRGAAHYRSVADPAARGRLGRLTEPRVRSRR